MATFWRIRDYSRHFTVSQARRMRDSSQARWFACPINWTTRGYNNLMRRKDGPAIFGAFIVLVQVATRCKTPGDLISDGCPITAADLSLMTRMPEKLFADLFNVLSSKDIRWIEELPLSESSPSTLGEHSESSQTPLRRIREEEERKKRGGEPARAQEPLPSGPFPVDGIPYRIASALRNICPTLAEQITPDAIATGPWLVSRNQQMPYEEWLQAAQEFAAHINGGGEIKPGKTWATTLASYVGNRCTTWQRDLQFQASREAHPPQKNNFGGHAAVNVDPLGNPVVGT